MWYLFVISWIFIALGLSANLVAEQIVVFFPPGSNSAVDTFLTWRWTIWLAWFMAIPLVWSLVKIWLDRKPPNPERLSLEAQVTAMVFASLVSAVILATQALNIHYYFTNESFTYLAGAGLAVSSVPVVFVLIASQSGSLMRILLGAVVFWMLWLRFANAMGDSLAKYNLELLVVYLAMLGIGWFWFLLGNSRGSNVRDVLLRTLVLGVALAIGQRFLKNQEMDLAVSIFADVFYMILMFSLVFILYDWFVIGFQKLSSRMLLQSFLVLGVVLFSSVMGWYLSQKSLQWTIPVENNRPFAKAMTTTASRIFGSGKRHGEQIEVIRRKIAALRASDAKTPASPQPVISGDIFVFVADATTRSRLSAYGYQRDTSPVLKAFAETAVRYDNFHATSSATFQGVLSMFFQTPVGRSPDTLKGQIPSLCTGLQGHSMLMADTGWPLLDLGTSCGAERLSYEGLSPEDFARVLSARKEYPGKPLFWYVHVKGGHNPWQIPVGGRSFGVERLDIYDGMMHAADSQFGQFLDLVKDAGLFEQATIAFTADHGIGLGNHFDMSSYSHLYNENLEIPLIVKYPGQNQGEINDDLLSQAEFQKVLAREAHGEDCVFAVAEYRHSYASVCRDGWKVIWDVGDNMLHLYQRTDRLEKRNLADDKDYTEKILDLAQPLIEFLGSRPDLPL